MSGQDPAHIVGCKNRCRLLDAGSSFYSNVKAAFDGQMSFQIDNNKSILFGGGKKYGI
jgi:hypothetical protein